MTIRWTGPIVVAAVMAATAAYGQTEKPVCGFSPEGGPAWMTCGFVDAEAPDSYLRQFVAPCAAGYRLVAQVAYHHPPIDPAGPLAAAALAKFQRLGLAGCVVAQTIGEEWYERFYADEFARWGFPATREDGPRQIHAWMGRQHEAAKAANGWPVIWLTGIVYGERAVPASTDYVMLDPYPADGQTFAASVAPIFLYAEQATALPLIATCRWFANVGPKQGPIWRTGAMLPTMEMIEGCAAIARRPRYVAMVGFLWASRPAADLIGLADMPATVREAVARSMQRGQ